MSMENMNIGLTDDNLKYHLIKHIPNCNQLDIFYGKKINDFIFKTKFTSKKDDTYNLVPIINSYFSDCNIKNMIISSIKEFYLDDKVLFISNSINSNQSQTCFTKKMVDFNIIESTNNDICMRFNQFTKINNLYFESMKNYNHSTQYLQLKWLFDFDIELIIKVYSSYFIINIKVKLEEKHKCPLDKENLIYNIHKKVNHILDVI